MDQSTKRRAMAARKMQDIKTFKQSSHRGGPSGGTEYTHVPSGVGAGEPPPGFKTWHEVYATRRQNTNEDSSS